MGPGRDAKSAIPGTSGPAAKGIKVSDLDGLDPESTDFANYFCTYGYLYHQARQALAGLVAYVIHILVSCKLTGTEALVGLDVLLPQRSLLSPPSANSYGAAERHAGGPQADWCILPGSNAE